MRSARVRRGPHELQLRAGAARPGRGGRAGPCPSPGPPTSPWPLRHAAGRPASRGGTPARRGAVAPAFISWGRLPKKRLTPLKKEKKEKHTTTTNKSKLIRPNFCFRPDWDCTLRILRFFFLVGGQGKGGTLSRPAQGEAPAAPGSPLTPRVPSSPFACLLGLVPAFPLRKARGPRDLRQESASPLGSGI